MGKGLRYSVDSSGRKSVVAGIHATGISYSQSVGSVAREHIRALHIKNH